MFGASALLSRWRTLRAQGRRWQFEMPKLGGRAARLTDVVARFHDRELEIWRRCTHEAAFREVCEDYQEAVEAARYWASPEHPDDRKAEEYRALVADLENEILSALG